MIVLLQHRLCAYARHWRKANGDGTFDRAEAFVYDGSETVLAFDVPPIGASGQSSLTHRFLSDPATDAVFADEDALGEVLWYMTDNQGTVRDVLDYEREEIEPGVWSETRTVVDHLSFSSFGKITDESDPSARPVLVWTGIYPDPLTGMQHHLHRWYDPATRRWLSSDPIGFTAGDTNLQRYVGNGPTNWVDPSGLTPASDFLDTASAAQLAAWIQQFNAQFGAYISAAAPAHNVPQELLAAVIANEFLDMQPLEALGEQLGIGQSVGPAQLRVDVAIRYNLFPDICPNDFRPRYRPTNLTPSRFHSVTSDSDATHSAYEAAIRAALLNPKRNIDAAARLMRIYLNQLLAAARKNTISDSFMAEILGIHASYDDATGERTAPLDTAAGKLFIAELEKLANLPKDEIVGYDVSQMMLAALAAIFNDDSHIITRPWQSELAVPHAINIHYFDDQFLGSLRPNPRPASSRPRTRPTHSGGHIPSPHAGSTWHPNPHY